MGDSGPLVAAPPRLTSNRGQPGGHGRPIGNSSSEAYKSVTITGVALVVTLDLKDDSWR